MPVLEVRSRVVGGGSPSLPTVLVELSSDTVQVRELIRRAVEEQVRELAVASSADAGRRALDRQYLLDEEIRALAAEGTVRLPAAPRGSAPDPEVEVERALRAFERRQFALFVGSRQILGLDDEVTLRLGEPVVFLRLTALAGG